jgi:hypothetical protein
MLERWCFSKTEPSTELISKVLPIAQVGALGRCVASEIERFMQRHSQHKDLDWHVKVCLDEAECLSASQQQALNTMVRLLESELSFVVSYVRAADVTTTLTPNISLQEADRDLMILDDMSDSEFEELAEGVATVRLNRFVKDTPQFHTRELLGSLDINEILSSILQTSASPEAKRVLRVAEELAQTPYYLDAKGGEGSRTNSLPIYEAYLIDRLSLQTPSPDSAQWEKRRQHSAEIRKRMVSAYLCLCKELKTNVKYASADMLFQMSDKCIRDYLNQVDSLFQEVRKPVADFCNTRISIDQQNSALSAASGRKKDAIPRSEVGSPAETLRLIDALGRLTGRLQTTTSQHRSLRSSELGIFVLDKAPLVQEEEESRDALRLIVEAAEAGFLKIVGQKNGSLRFRVHCSLAAAYEFSYRGAYYNCPIRMHDVIAFYREQDDDAREKKILTTANYLLQQSSTLPLFEGEK